MLNSHASITEINAAIAQGTATEDEARTLLKTRKARKGVSGRNARAWLAAHPEAKSPARTRKAQVTPTPAPERKRPGRPATPIEDLDVEGLVKRLATARATRKVPAVGSGDWWGEYRAQKARIGATALRHEAHIARKVLMASIRQGL